MLFVNNLYIQCVPSLSVEYLVANAQLSLEKKDLALKETTIVS
jgi:hypothetical protein